MKTTPIRSGKWAFAYVERNWYRQRQKLQNLQAVLKVERPLQTAKTLLRKCPCCKTGTLVTIEVFGQRGPPKNYLLVKQNAPVPTIL